MKPTHPGVLEICCASHARYIHQDLRRSELLARARARWKEWVVWLDSRVGTPPESRAGMPPRAEPSKLGFLHTAGHVECQRGTHL